MSTRKTRRVKKAKISSKHVYHNVDGSISYVIPKVLTGKKDPETGKPKTKDYQCIFIKGQRLIPAPIDWGTTILYRLPEVIQAASGGRLIYLTSDETEADLLAKHGLTATALTGSFKAGICLLSIERIRGCAGVYIILSDRRRSTGAPQVADRLAEAGIPVYVVRIPNKHRSTDDLLDWFDQGHTKDELVAICSSASLWEPGNRLAKLPVARAESLVQGAELFTDLANSKRLIKRHGHNLRRSGGEWFIHDGKRWLPDTNQMIEALAKETAEHIYEERDSVPSRLHSKLHEWAIKSQSQGAITRMAALAESDRSIQVDRNDWDQVPWLLNVENGTLDLRTGTLHPHNRMLNITKLAAVEFDGKAECPGWYRLLSEFFNGDSELVSFFRRWVGYSFTGLTTERKALFLQSSENAGHLSHILLRLAGDYGKLISPDSFDAKAGNRRIDDLRGIRLAVLADLPLGYAIHHRKFRSVINGHQQRAYKSHRTAIDYFPVAKLWLDTVREPVIGASTDAVLPVQSTRQLVALPETLWSERSGILNFIVAGAMEYATSGLCPPDSVTGRINSIAEFIAQRCHVTPHAVTGSAELYREYLNFCTDNQREPSSQIAFSREINRRFRKKKAASGMVFHGVGICGTAGGGITPPQPGTTTSFGGVNE